MRPESIERHIAYFISPHGYGHAARAAAIMEAACMIDHRLRFEIFTQVPRWFFQQSLTKAFGYHHVLTDIGLVQTTPLVVNLPETLRRLDGFLPFDEQLIESLAQRLVELRCSAVVCDIAPLGIRVAERARLASVLIENFTWDWIYEEYFDEDPRIVRHADYLREAFKAAQYHVQTEPVSVPVRSADLVSPPVSRAPRVPAPLVRQRLGIPENAKSVLITMGGIQIEHTFLHLLERERETFFVIPGGSPAQEIRGNLVLLPHASDFYHPDLVNASDAVVGKLGYSTVAEAFHAGVPFCYVTRPGFRESETMANFVQTRMRARALTDGEFESANWLPLLEELIAPPRATVADARPNGAQAVAAFLCALPVR